MSHCTGTVGCTAVTAAAISKIAPTWRPLSSRSWHRASGAQAPNGPDGCGVVVLIAVALLVPLPSAVQLRDWSTSMGPWFPLAFLAAHIVVTVLPFPRTAFTLAAGLLFGPVLGVALAVAASTVSAMIALALVRAAGWQLSRLVRHQAVETARRPTARPRLACGHVAAVDSRGTVLAAQLRRRRVRGAGAALHVGNGGRSVPGTAAVVILGDALTGHVSPLLFLVSLCTGIVGIALLAYEIRHHRRHHNAPATETGDTAEQALRG